MLKCLFFILAGARESDTPATPGWMKIKRKEGSRGLPRDI